jgi:hypothetical protein
MGTLNASGPISLGGSTTGQSVNLALGNSATATISFNDFAVRATTGTTAGTSLSMPTNFWGKAANPAVTNYLLGTSGGSSWAFVRPLSMLTDSSGNVYVFGYNSTSSPYPPCVIKYDSTGTLLWQKQYTATGYYMTGFYLDSCPPAIDASGNIYLFVADITTNTTTSYVMKIDSSGAVVYARPYVASPGYILSSVNSIVIASTGNPIFLITYMNNTTYAQAWSVVKLTADGSITNGVQYAASVSTATPNGVQLTVDSSDNLYIVSNSYYSSKYYQVLVKLNSSLALQYTYSYVWGTFPSDRVTTTLGPPTSTAGVVYATQVYEKSTGEIYAGLGTITLSTGAYTQTVAYELKNSFVRLWKDSSNNIYLIGLKVGLGAYTLFKFNSSLSLQYQTDFSKVNDYPQFLGTGASYNNSIFLLAQGGSYSSSAYQSAGSLLFELPNNNALSGNTITYSTSPVTCTTTLSAGTTTTATTPVLTQGTWAYAGSTSSASLNVYPNMTVTVTNTTYTEQRRTQP